MNEQLKQDIAAVLSAVDYEFDKCGRHEETLEAYNRVRNAIEALPELIEALGENLAWHLLSGRAKRPVKACDTQTGSRMLLQTTSVLARCGVSLDKPD